MKSIETSFIDLNIHALPSATPRDKAFTYAAISQRPVDPDKIERHIDYHASNACYDNNKDAAKALLREIRHVSPDNLPWNTGKGVFSGKYMENFLSSREKFAALLKYTLTCGQPFKSGSELWSAPIGTHHNVMFRLQQSGKFVEKVQFASAGDKARAIEARKNAHKKDAIRWLDKLGMVDSTSGAQKFSSTKEKLMLNPAQSGRVSDETVGRAIHHAAEKLVTKQQDKVDDNGAYLHEGKINGVMARAYIKKDSGGDIESVRFVPLNSQSESSRS